MAARRIGYPRLDFIFPHFMITEPHVLYFQDIYWRCFGEKIDLSEAQTKATKLIALVKALLKTISNPKNE